METPDIQSKQPIHINEGFQCDNCGKQTPKHAQSCRNHCKFCLFSKHVDGNTPGDRKSRCNGLMEPVEIAPNSQKGEQILHCCQKCNKKSSNIIAGDDSAEKITRITLEQNIKSPQRQTIRQRRRHNNNYD